MVVGLVAEGDALALKLLQALVVDVRRFGNRRGRVVTENVSHVVEQARGREQDGGKVLFAALHALGEKFRVGMAALTRRREPFVGGVRVMRNALARKVNLS